MADPKQTNFGEYVSMSSFFVLPSNLLSASAYDDILNWKKSSSKDAFVEVDVLGPKSKVAAVATPDTAYPYRPALLVIQYGTRWRNKKDENKNVQATEALTAIVDPFLANPQVPREINYLTVQSPNLLGYYGSNLPRLISIKTQYDPQNYFQNPLGIPSNADGQFSVPDTASQGDINGDGLVDAGDVVNVGDVVDSGTPVDSIVSSAATMHGPLGPLGTVGTVGTIGTIGAVIVSTVVLVIS